MRFQKCLALLAFAALAVPLLTGQSAYASKPDLLLDPAARDAASTGVFGVIQEENDSLPPYTATAPNAYTIHTSSGLTQLVADLGGPLSDSLLNASITLGCDVDLGQSLWVPIGDNDHPYQGTFDGQGHTITGLQIVQAYEVRTLVSAYAGLFSSLGIQGAVVNLNLLESSVSLTGRTSYTGTIAGSSFGRIENCSVTNGTVFSDYSTGGMVGINNGDIKNCTVTNTTVTASVPSSKSGYCQAGGIVGINYYGMPGARDGLVDTCTVSESLIQASVAADDSRALAGGIAGENDYTTIVQSYVYDSKIQAKNSSDSYNTYYNDAAVAGGVAGYCFGSLSTTESNGLSGCGALGTTSVEAVAAKYGYAGGIAGRSLSNNEITNCFSVGISVAAKSTGGTDIYSFYAGGIVGENVNSIIFGCTISDVSTRSNSKKAHVGDLVGDMDGGLLTRSRVGGQFL